ncbi:MAG TPA: carbohydrate-binding protein [Syntrophomonadaceae bacterium]|jgi:hypothetical protein|nr:carbohydrate-binding protein [Syntrophomonadaceae bacterium]HRX21083.1 carbohydrate-binding protein [Syntrophomonadaceae bacterium]
MAGTDLPGGVYIDPIPPSLGSDVKIKYNGKLAGNKADEIILCVGYGFKEDPFNQQEFTMSKKSKGFETQFTVNASDTLNFYFKDQQGEVDDNQGEKWQVAVDTENLSYA